jgi:hypothetical protein
VSFRWALGGEGLELVGRVELEVLEGHGRQRVKISRWREWACCTTSLRAGQDLLP